MKQIAMVGLILLMLVSACAQQVVNDADANDDLVPESAQQGRAVFAVTDAAADMGAVTSVVVTIDSVEVFSEANGWIRVSSTPKTYDLLQLKAEDKNELLADVQIDEGTYEQIRLDISGVMVTDANGTHEAKLPSGELKINGELVVQANSTSAATFDFIADESLHVTGNGKYIMAPVVQIETRADADVEVKGGSRVEVKGGDVKTSVEVGMDIDGNVGAGLKVPKDLDLSIDASGLIKLGKETKAGSKLGVGLGLD